MYALGEVLHHVREKVSVDESVMITDRGGENWGVKVNLICYLNVNDKFPFSHWWSTRSLERGSNARSYGVPHARITVVNFKSWHKIFKPLIPNKNRPAIWFKRRKFQKWDIGWCEERQMWADLCHLLYFTIQHTLNSGRYQLSPRTSGETADAKIPVQRSAAVKISELQDCQQVFFCLSFMYIVVSLWST